MSDGTDGTNDMPRDEHALWDELAAGYSLHALDADEERDFLIHLAGCGRCEATVDDYALVAAQLGSLADGADASDDEDAEPPAWSAVRTAVLSADAASSARAEEALAGAETPAAVADLATARQGRQHQRRQRRGRWVAAAAALVLVAGGLGVAGVLHRSSPSGQPPALASCAQQQGCRVVKLHSAGTVPAAIVVNGSGASIVPMAMQPAPAGRTYVLWQLPRDGSPLMVAAFHDTRRESAPEPLVRSYADTAAFAVSLEPAGTTPSRPSDVIAIGAAAA